MCFHNFQILHNLSGAKKVEITFIKICPFSNLFVKISKGQLISKCLYNLIILTKLATKMLEGFLKDIFLEFPGSFLGLPVGFLIDDIMYIPKKPKSLQYFRCYFGRNNDTKKTFQNQLTFASFSKIVLAFDC